ncbi:hypothetical protein [Actinomadura bangladeshensis]|uniref:HD domain-containing protein n=1 Tax=Actinomadura bangladeshensis TaxID=453573 RepID=A0A4R4NX49_9ACTN|nr:hypothetical protein [Actinomadura bangladeshensis]TDC12052.1 hypothetical protein E1284_25530 [Actinomadura bangladeshensis]
METGQLSVDLRRRIGRLRHITGFVTTYGQEVDPRLSVFARLWHVKRVVSTADRLSGLTESLDGAKIERLAWLHDLNRWPFAHNSEKGFFDQAANVREYFLSRSPTIGTQDIDDLVGIHLKDPSVISAEGRIVLFADSLTGVIEDPLFTVCGLNVHPRIIPQSVSDMLGFSLLADPWYASCFQLAEEFHRAENPDVEFFQKQFHELFGALLSEFIDVHRIDSLEEGQEDLFAIARTVKETFMRPVIFPLNNEKVCHSSWLRQEVMPWYLAHVPDARQRLLEIDEDGFVELVTQIGGSPFTAREFIPDLGYVRREAPEMAFIGPGESRGRAL